MYPPALNKMKPAQLLLSAAILMSLSQLSLAQLAPSVAETVSIDGEDMYYEIYGEGEPLLLLHYWTGATGIWAPFIEDFAKDYQVIVYDQKGHGRSGPLAINDDNKQLALDALALMDYLEIETFSAIGLSGGAMQLIHVATLEPERVESMILVGGGHYFTEETRAVQRATTFEAQSEESLANLRALHVRGDDQIKMLFMGMNMAANTYDSMNFTPPYLGTIKANTLIVFGDNDEYFPVHIPVEMHSAIPNSHLWIIPKGGHLPVFGDRQEEFTKQSLSFLSGEWTE